MIDPSVLLSEYDNYNRAIKTTIKEIYDAKTKLSNEIQSYVNLLRNIEDPSKIKEINSILNNLNEKYNIKRDEFNTVISHIIPTIYNNHPKIYELIEHGLKRSDFCNVLKTFDSYQKGQITEKNALKQGINYAKVNYNVPDNFINEKGLLND
jgi:hypothetical protein